MKVIVITAHRRYASLYFILGFADEVNESSNLAKRSHFLTGFSHGLQNPFAMLELIQFCVGEFGGGWVQEWIKYVYASLGILF